MLRFFVCLFALVAIHAFPSTSAAGEQVRNIELIKLLTPLIDKVIANLPNKSNSVKVAFDEHDVAGPRCQTNLLSNAIEMLLQKKEIKVISTQAPDKPDLWLQGQLKTTKSDGNPGIELSLTLKNEKAIIEQPIRQAIANLQLCYTLFGLTGAPETSNNEKDQAQSLAELLTLLNNPPQKNAPEQFFKWKDANGNFSNTRIKGKQDSPYSVEILVAKENLIPAGVENAWKGVPAREIKVGKKGEPEIEIAPGEAYAIRLCYQPRDERIARDNAHGAGAEIFIDGLSDFHFSKLRDAADASLPKYHRWFVPPGKALIPGWHSTNENSHLFVVNELGKGATAAKNVPPTVKPSDSIGIITVRFYACWTGQKPPPEIADLKDVGKETTIGKEIINRVEEVRTQTSEKVLDIVSIRYARRK